MACPDQERGNPHFSSIVMFCLRILGLWSEDVKGSLNDEESCKRNQDGDNDNNLKIETFTCLEETKQLNYHVDAELTPLLLSSDNPSRKRKLMLRRSMLWLFIPSVVLICMICDLMFYLVSFWGHHSQILFLISYYTFIPQLAVIPIICLAARCRCFLFVKSEPNRNPVVMSREYLLNRLRSTQNATDASEGAADTCLTNSYCKDALLFAALFIWPLTNIILVAYSYFKFELVVDHFKDTEKWRCQVRVLNGRSAAVVGYGLYTCFCLIIYRLRLSHLEEFIAIANNIQRENMSINEANANIRQAFCAFTGFRNVVGTWSTFTIAVGTLGIFMQLSWNYGVHKSEEYEEHSKSEAAVHEVLMLGIMMWSEKLMFLVQPVFVIGGVNADYLWVKFKRIITENLQVKDQSGKVNDILLHMYNIDTSVKWIKPTITLTLVNLYMGMHLKKQDLNYFIGPDCI